MANADKTMYITRREFCMALVMVWLYIWFVIGDLWWLEWRWTTFVLWLASLFMMIVYLVQSFRSSRPGGDGTRAPLSERVKEIASDPLRTIEAIRVYREETGASLEDAKEAIEAFIRSK
jgi:hypothetical protein